MKLFNIFKRNLAPQNIVTHVNPVSGKLFSEINYNSANYLNNAAIQRGINAISNAVASSKINTYKIFKGNKSLYDSNIDLLLNIAPNNSMSAYTFKKIMIENVFNYGNALIKIDRDINNNINNLYLMNSQSLNCLYNSIDNTAKYTYAGKELDMSDYILFYLYPNKSFGGLFGTPFAAYAADTLRSKQLVNNYQSKYFSSNGVTGILSPRQQQSGRPMPSDTAAAGAKQKFIDASVDGIVFLDSDYEYSRLGSTMKDTMIIELQKYSTDDIARVLNIPQSFLFNTDKEISESDYISFYSQTLQPIFENLENLFITKFLFKKDYNKYIFEFDYENLLKTNKTILVDYYTKVFQMGAISPNEIAQKLNINISSENMANERYISQNMQPLSANLNLIKQQKVNNETENNL